MLANILAVDNQLLILSRQLLDLQIDFLLRHRLTLARSNHCSMSAQFYRVIRQSARPSSCSRRRMREVVKVEKCQLMTFAACSHSALNHLSIYCRLHNSIKPFCKFHPSIAHILMLGLSPHHRPLKWNVPVRGSSGNCALFSPCFATLGPNNGTMAAHTHCKTQLPLVQLNPWKNG